MEASRAAARASARARILDAAVKLIAREGINDVRIARIAREAGVSPSLLHYHFASRDALLAEALEHSYELAGTIRIGPDDEPAPAAERLRTMIDQCLPAPGALRDDWLLWVELWLHAARRPELRPTAARLYARMHEWFGETIAEGAASGEFTVADADRTDRPPARADRRLRHPRAGRRPGDADRARARGDLGGGRRRPRRGGLRRADGARRGSGAARRRGGASARRRERAAARHRASSSRSAVGQRAAGDLERRRGLDGDAVVVGRDRLARAERSRGRRRPACTSP